MPPYENIRKLIDDLIENSTTAFEKPRFMTALLELDNFDGTLTNILRNPQLKNRYRQLGCSSSYYTVVGELLLHYFTDSLEQDLRDLTNDEKRQLIQKINEKLG